MPDEETQIIGSAFNRMAEAVEQKWQAERAASEAQASLAQNRELAQLVEQRLDEERRAIARELHDEFDKTTPMPVRELEDGVAEVEATMHVSEVNEALDLEIPEEEDYETLGGFVLAELGHFPAKGESFRRGKAEFSVLEANDRRVLKVLVRRTEPVQAS